MRVCVRACVFWVSVFSTLLHMIICFSVHVSSQQAALFAVNYPLVLYFGVAVMLKNVTADCVRAQSVQTPLTISLATREPYGSGA